MGLAAEPAHFLEAQDVGAARRRAVRRHRTRRHEPRLDRFAHPRLEHARKPWCGSLGLIDHVTGEHEHRWDREYARDHVAVKIQRMRQQLRLSACGAHVAIPFARKLRRLSVVFSRVIDAAEDQLGFTLRRSAPVAGLLGLALFDGRAADRQRLVRELMRARLVAQQHGHRRRIDAGVIRVGERSALARRDVRALVQLEPRTQVCHTARGIRHAQAEVLVRAREHPESLGIVQAALCELAEQHVRALSVAAARQRKRLQLREPDVPG